MVVGSNGSMRRVTQPMTSGMAMIAVNPAKQRKYVSSSGRRNVTVRRPPSTQPRPDSRMVLSQTESVTRLVVIFEPDIQWRRAVRHNPRSIRGARQCRVHVESRKRERALATVPDENIHSQESRTCPTEESRTCPTEARASYCRNFF